MMQSNRIRRRCNLQNLFYFIDKTKNLYLAVHCHDFAKQAGDYRLFRWHKKKFKLLYVVFSLAFLVTGNPSQSSQGTTDKLNCFSTYFLINYQAHHLGWEAPKIYSENKNNLDPYINEYHKRKGGDYLGSQIIFMFAAINRGNWEHNTTEGFRKSLYELEGDLLRISTVSYSLTHRNEEAVCPMYAIANNSQ